jgi:hypothetical protein
VEIHHTSYSKTENENMASFLARFAEELKKIGAIEIVDITFNFPDPETANTITSATVYYNSAKEEPYKMQTKAFMQTAKNASEALIKANSDAETWFRDNDVSLYDVSSKLMLDENGNDVVRVNLYFEP